MRDPLPNGELCGAGEVCCGGICCTATQCCGESGSCAECGPHCTIGNDTPAEGTPNPDGSCWVCAPTVDPFYWSPAPDDMRCGLDRSQFCCAGSCQPEPCEPQCTIEGIPPVEADTVNIDNRCQICKPDQNTSAWTTLPNKASCGTNPAQGRVCCSGVCCDVLQCCDAEGQCSNKCDPFCTILDEESGDPEEVPDGEPNPDNPCERCNIVANPNGWTKLEFPTPCGDAGQFRVCCVGICCAPGETCDSVTLSCVEDCSVQDGNRGDGSCEPDAEGCTIDGLVYPAGTVNPAQECQVCDPNANPTAWTARANDEICGPNGDHACCDGVCCTGSGCCVPGRGGQCSVEYCGFIDPCEGMDPCGCTIGGAFYENGALNPANECESCNVSASTSAWTPKAFGGCGGEQYRYCAGGVCCDLGFCPDYATNTCGDYCDDVCVIGGVLYFGLDRNPATPCQHCAPPSATRPGRTCPPTTSATRSPAPAPAASRRAAARAPGAATRAFASPSSDGRLGPPPQTGSRSATTAPDGPVAAPVA